MAEVPLVAPGNGKTVAAKGEPLNIVADELLNTANSNFYQGVSKHQIQRCEKQALRKGVDPHPVLPTPTQLRRPELPRETVQTRTWSLCNVCVKFKCGVPLDCRAVALKFVNTEHYRQTPKKVYMRLRTPTKATCVIHSTGQVIVLGAKTVQAAKKCALSCAKLLHIIEPDVQFLDYCVINMLAFYYVGHPVDLYELQEHHNDNASYDARVFTSVRYSLRDPKCACHVFSNGNITIVGAKTTTDIDHAVAKITEIVGPHALQDPPKDGEEADAHETLCPVSGLDSAPDVAAPCSPNPVYNAACYNNLQAPNAGGFDALRPAVVHNHNPHGPGAGGGHSLHSVGAPGHDAQPQAGGHSVSQHGRGAAGGCQPQVLCAEQCNLQGPRAAAGYGAQMQGVDPCGAEAQHEDREKDCERGDGINKDAFLEDMDLLFDLGPFGEEMDPSAS